MKSDLSRKLYLTLIFLALFETVVNQGFDQSRRDALDSVVEIVIAVCIFVGSAITAWVVRLELTVVDDDGLSRFWGTRR